MRESLSRIRDQFRRQADAYERMRNVTDPAGLGALVAVAGTGPSDRVLDVACGPGFLTMTFAERSAHATGIDATDRFLEDARREAARRGVANVAFLLGDAEAMPFGAASFDVVACRAAFHHFPEPERVLDEMARVARPGGRVLVADQVSSEDRDKAALHNRVERLCDPTHARALAPSEFLALFAERGLEVVVDAARTLDYALPDWIAHGGPPPERAREIEALMRGAIEGDRAGLAVRVADDGEIWFSHEARAYVARRPAR